MKPALIAASLAALLAVSAQAQTYPSAPVTVVVPFAAGSGTDAVARVVMQKLSEQLKQPVLVDNKPGASAQIAANYVAKAKPDGYTLMMTTNTSHSANPALFANLKYDPVKDFTPVARVGELPFVLAVNNDFPAKTLPGLGPDPLPKQLTSPSQRLLERITTITGPLTANRT